MTPARPQSEPVPSLRLPRNEAEEKIAAQIDAGQNLLCMLDDSGYSLIEFLAEQTKWHSKNEFMLRALFHPPNEMLERYARPIPPTFRIGPFSSLPLSGIESQHKLRDTTQARINALDDIRDSLEYCTHVEAAPQARPANRAASVSRDVFVVHGHDEAAKQSVARFIEKLGLRAIILHEQPSGGRTIIEKFEEESSSVGYAVVLLTPDDIGAPGDKPEESKRRARQNVIFELGFFVAGLGRDKVCVLHKGNVDIPSDYQGVIYVPMDEAGAWQMSLAREMKEAGIDLDLNKVL